MKCVLCDRTATTGFVEDKCSNVSACTRRQVKAGLYRPMLDRGPSIATRDRFASMRRACATREDWAQIVVETDQALRDAVIAAFAAGWPASAIAGVVDLSVARCYQIRDGRR